MATTKTRVQEEQEKLKALVRVLSKDYNLTIKQSEAIVTTVHGYGVQFINDVRGIK